jgi:D-alanyl-D-alanine carboxypeptidase (penicillin-binding protein 5/6)
MFFLNSFVFTNTITRAEEIPNLNLMSRSVVLMEPNTGQVLFSKNEHEKLSPASVTKIMTILLIYEALHQGKIKFNDTVTISEHAAEMGGSQVFLESGEQQSVKNLLKSIIIPSGNDASVAMAEFIGGSEENFVNLMNKKAKKLGMKNTFFLNSCGLTADGHETTAYDIALMTRELINKYPDVLDYSKIWQDKITHVTRRGESEFVLTNTNKLLKIYNGANGLKTGFTDKALFCLSATAERDGMNLIAVIMASPTAKDRFAEASKLLDYGFANYCVIYGEPTGTITGEVKIYKGKQEKVGVSIEKQAGVLVNKSSRKNLKSKFIFDKKIFAPILKNQKLGEIIYYIDNREVARSNLISTQDIAKANIFDIFSRLIRRIF